MPFDQHIASGRAVLGFPKDLVLTAIDPRAFPGDELSGEQVRNGVAARAEGPGHGPWRSLGMAPDTLCPERRLGIGEPVSSSQAASSASWTVTSEAARWTCCRFL